MSLHASRPTDRICSDSRIMFCDRTMIMIILLTCLIAATEPRRLELMRRNKNRKLINMINLVRRRHAVFFTVRVRRENRFVISCSSSVARAGRSSHIAVIYANLFRLTVQVTERSEITTKCGRHSTLTPHPNGTIHRATLVSIVQPTILRGN